METSSYPFSGQAAELDRLQLQSRVWEPAGRRLLDEVGAGAGGRALDVGCGALGWLRLLSEWVGPEGEVVGTDIDEAMLSAARTISSAEALHNVELLRDDLFATHLAPDSFDLVHARFMAVLGRAPDQMDTYLRWVRPGGIVVLEDVDPVSWHFIPSAPALDQLIRLVIQAFHKRGVGDPSRIQLEMFRNAGIEVHARAEVLALAPGHPYQRLPLQFAAALEAPLKSMAGEDELERLREEAERELEDREHWGVTFTLFQTWGRREA